MRYKDGLTKQPGVAALGISKAKGQLVLLIGGVLLFVILIIWIGALNSKPARAESYKDTSGAAGLEAQINYICKTSCEQKFDLNVYIFNSDGGQVSVVRPDKEGRVRTALPEGNYNMLIGKQLGKEQLFPQEPMALKNGKTLELKLQYEEE